MHNTPTALSSCCDRDKRATLRVNRHLSSVTILSSYSSFIWVKLCSPKLLFLNNLPVCCSVSPGSATLDPISGPRQANLGQSCGRFLNALNDCRTVVHACERVCLCVPVWISVLVCVWIYDYVCPLPEGHSPLCVRAQKNPSTSVALGPSCSRLSGVIQN